MLGRPLRWWRFLSCCLVARARSSYSYSLRARRSRAYQKEERCDRRQLEGTKLRRSRRCEQSPARMQWLINLLHPVRPRGQHPREERWQPPRILIDLHHQAREAQQWTRPSPQGHRDLKTALKVPRRAFYALIRRGHTPSSHVATSAFARRARAQTNTENAPYADVK